MPIRVWGFPIHEEKMVQVIPYRGALFRRRCAFHVGFKLLSTNMEMTLGMILDADWLFLWGVIRELSTS